MKRARLLTTLIISAGVLCALRAVLQLVMTDTVTGLWLNGFDLAGNTVTAIMLAVLVLIIALAGLTTAGHTVALPQRSVALALATAALGATLFVGGVLTLLQGFAARNVVYALTAVVAAVTLLWYAFSLMTGRKFFAPLLIACPAFAAVNLVFEITSFVGLVTVCNSLFALLGSCATMMLFTAVAKFAYLGHTAERAARSLVRYASAAVLLCGMPLVMRLISVALTGGYPLAFSFSEVVGLAVSLYSVVLILSVESRKLEQ